MMYTVKLVGLTYRTPSKFKALLAMLFWIATVFGFLSLASYGFMHLWAWYLPVFWANAPILSYWHSFATVTMLVFLRPVVRPLKK